MKSRMPERARTDPREPWGSNPLGPPGPELNMPSAAPHRFPLCDGPFRNLQIKPLPIECLDVRLEVVDDRVPGGRRLDLVKRAAFGAEVLAIHLPRTARRHQARIDLLQLLLRVPHVDQRVQLPVFPLVAEIVAALA